MWTSINKKLAIFLSIILVIGIILGIVFVVMLDEGVKEILFLNINEYLQSLKNVNNIFIHLIIISSLFILSIILIGGPLVLFFIFYNGFSIGFIISSLACIFGIKGILFGVIYVLITKFLYNVLFILLSINYFKIIKCVIEKVVYKKNNIESLYFFIKKCIIFIFIILINDVILYFWGRMIVNLFNFLIS